MPLGEIIWLICLCCWGPYLQVLIYGIDQGTVFKTYSQIAIITIKSVERAKIFFLYALSEQWQACDTTNLTS